MTDTLICKLTLKDFRMVNISDDFYQLAVAVTGLASRPGRTIGKRYAFQTLPIVESKSTSLILRVLWAGLWDSQTGARMASLVPKLSRFYSIITLKEGNK